MAYTYKIIEEKNIIKIYNDGYYIGAGNLFDDTIVCPKEAHDYLIKERNNFRESSLLYLKSERDSMKAKVDEFHKKYFNVLSKFEIYDQKVKELEKTFKPTKSPREILMAKAKKMFPIGTKFSSIFGAEDEIEDTNKVFGKKPPILYWNDDGDAIMANCKRETRMIYDNGTWARIYK